MAAVCDYREPVWLKTFSEQSNPPRPAGRILKRLKELEQLDDASEDRYFHLVDGAVSDNLGLRGVLDYLEAFEALRLAGQPTPLDHVRRIIVFVVNPASSPNWGTTREHWALRTADEQSRLPSTLWMALLRERCVPRFMVVPNVVAADGLRC
jgi:hypothetical protein